MNKRCVFDLCMKKSFALFALLDMLEWNILIMKEMRILVVIDIFILEWNDFIMRKLQIPASSNVVVWWNELMIVDIYIKI